MRKKTWVEGSLVGIVVVGAIFTFWAPANRFLIWATGNGRGCGLRECLDEIESRIIEEGMRVREASAVVERDGEGYELHRTPRGMFWSPAGNILYYNLGEMAVEAYGGEADGVRAGDVVLDCGANVGTFTRSALAAGASKVVAFEIDPRNAECLRRNFQKEAAEGRVVVIAQGVWSREGMVEVKVYSNSNWSTAAMPERPETEEKPRVVKLPVTRIDRVVEDLGLERVDFIKMDVEGAEVEALQGARTTLQRFRPRLSVATENLPDDVERVPAAVRAIVPEYQFRPGLCRKIRKFMIRPEVVHGWVQ
jgi:FkbM family methyltransferase